MQQITVDPWFYSHPRAFHSRLCKSTISTIVDVPSPSTRKLLLQSTTHLLTEV